MFPDAFAVTERAPYYDAGSNPKGRLLSAGFHLMHGYFRDDGPLCELILTAEQKRELDALWFELDFVTLAPVRQFKDFIFFERAEPPRFLIDAEFDFARSEDKDSASEAKMTKLAEPSATSVLVRRPATRLRHCRSKPIRALRPQATARSNAACSMVIVMIAPLPFLVPSQL